MYPISTFNGSHHHTSHALDMLQMKFVLLVHTIKAGHVTPRVDSECFQNICLLSGPGTRGEASVPNTFILLSAFLPKY